MRTDSPRAVAIICEYNPFHAGHAYQLAAARRDSGADVVLCIMSELLLQRGEPAVVDAYTRAEIAVRCGVDVVVGLPFPYSSAAAEHFAAAGVFLAAELGATWLHFGSECGDLARLRQGAVALSSPKWIHRLTEWQRTHPQQGVMEARDAVFGEMNISACLPEGSNDMLAMAYLSAIRQLSVPLIPLTIRRNGQSYRDDAANNHDSFASAAALRRLWQERQSLCDPIFRQQLPPAALQCLCHAEQIGMAPVFADRLMGAIQAFWRLSDPRDLASLEGLGGGVSQRLSSTARQQAYSDFSSFIAAAATKRYTNARLARAVWSGMCGVRPADVRRPPAYARVLACSNAGKGYLRAIRKKTTFSLITKPSDIPSTVAAGRQHVLEQSVASLYTLALPTPRAAGLFLTGKPYVEQS